MTLLDTGINWDIILKECVSQHRKHVKWIFWLYEQLCRIEEAKKITIPEKSRVFKICTDNWSKKPSDFMFDLGEEQIKKNIPKKYQNEILKNSKRIKHK
ncbi:hypothetical protein IH824_13185 [candidate division KSB1 bacterium]|nr:hypothetical protein [candidate division KSB1 bacterium]